MEGLKAGTTTFLDHAAPFPGWAESFDRAGVRARLAVLISALGPGAGLSGIYALTLDDPRTGLGQAVTYARSWQGAAGGRVTTLLGPAAADLVLREHLVQIKRAAEREGLMIHMHVAQGEREIAQMLARYGQRTPQSLDELGYLDDSLIAVHLTEATQDEVKVMASRGVRMVLCSGAIALTDGIVPPALSFKAAGGRVALGSDSGTASMFNEMRLTAFRNKVVRRDPKLMPSWEVLRMVTLKGSRTGVFFGVVWSHYARLLHQGGLTALTQHTVTGFHHSIVANRVSYVLGLQGPSLAIDTSCSSSLVAVHLACESLRRGESTAALAGGANLTLIPESTLGVLCREEPKHQSRAGIVFVFSGQGS